MLLIVNRNSLKYNLRFTLEIPDPKKNDDQFIHHYD